MNERLLILAAVSIAHASANIATIGEARSVVNDQRDTIWNMLRVGGTFPQIEDWKRGLADCDTWLSAADQLEERNKMIERFREKVRNAPDFVLSDEERANLDRIEAEAKERGYLSNGEVLLGLLTRAHEENARLLSLLHASEDPIIRSLAKAKFVPGTIEELDALRKAEEEDATGTRKYNNGMPILESMLMGARVERDRVKLLPAKWLNKADEEDDACVREAMRDCAEELDNVLDEPADAPISDPAERAKAVAKELRSRGLSAKDSRNDISDQSIVAVMGFEDPDSHHGRLGFQWSIQLYRLREQPFASMTTLLAIADRIQSEEAKRAKAWAGDE